MSSCCLTIADLMEDALDDTIAALGVTASYYPQVLTGYDTATTVRTPSEEAVVSVTGIFSNLRQTGPDNTLQQVAQFFFAHSTTLGFTPNALDRLVVNGFSYRATALEVAHIADTPLSYTLTLASD